MIRNDEKLFQELNARLAKEGLSLTIICVGGYVLNRYGMRTTKDIDAFYADTQKINKIIYEIGNEYQVNTGDELWLNNSVQNMNRRPPEEICETLYDFSNLKVLSPPLDYIAGMKISSARGQDVEDVASIIKKLSIKDPDKLSQALKKYGFGDIDNSLMLEAFGLAYGMDWLEKYYIKHEKEILSKIKGDNS